MIEVVKNGFKKIREEQVRLRRELRDRTVSYVVAALGLVAALAWNDAIKTTIEYLLPLKSNALAVKLLYAFIITLIVVTVSVYLLRLTEDKKE